MCMSYMLFYLQNPWKGASYLFENSLSELTEYVLNTVDQHGLRKEREGEGRKGRNLQYIFIRRIFIILSYKEKESNYKL